VSTNFLYFPVSSTDMSIGNCIMFHNTPVQKEIFMGIGSIQKITFRKICFFGKWIRYKLKKRGKKTKSFFGKKRKKGNKTKNFCHAISTQSI
jgi:hypothetical protein